MNAFIIIGIVFYFLAWIQLTISSYVKVKSEKTRESFLRVHERVVKELEEIHNQKKELDEKIKELYKERMSLLMTKVEIKNNEDSK